MKKRCFIIGPMKDMKRFTRLAYEIIQPIVNSHNFEVVIPLEGVDGHIMHHVMLELDRADLLIADISEFNPNVFYELGFYHSLGKASLLLLEQAGDEAVMLPFDIQSYRHEIINFENVPECIQRLKPKLENLISRIDFEEKFNNPITDYFDAPITELPTSLGLFKNYEKNFLKQIVPTVFSKIEGADNYMLEIKEDKKHNPPRTLTPEERDKLKVRILVPEKLEYARHDEIKAYKESKRLNSESWAINKSSRPFGVSLIFEKDVPVILDIPTVLASLEESITHRRKKNKFADKEWDVLEQRELEKFCSRCLVYHKELSSFLRNRVEFVFNWKPF